ncbi:MAG TPA: hypothetical protein VMG82_40540, partial [Candidatus Sulfotelmatobacter sp.]|nr:hypothetical protein [Candidatus Sulfotelmatobacter sp.]
MTACFEFNKLMVVIVAGFFMTSCGSPSGSSDPSRNHGTTSPPISVSVAPPNGSLQTSNTQNFTATVQNDSQDKGVTWSLSGAGCSGTSCGTLSAASSDSGVPITYTAPIAVPNPATVSLTAASATDNTKTGTATVTITAAPPPISVSIAPPSASVQSGNTQAFAATVQNDSQDKGVTWSLSGAGCSGTSCGTLSAASSASGMPITYTAPIAVPNPASVSLTATSVADNTKSAVAAITVTAASTGSVSLSPKRGGLVVSQSLTFAATVTNDVGNAGVTWSSTSGAFSNQTTTSATFTAPSSAGLVSITATSKADPTKSVSATIGVTDLAGVRTYHNDLSRDGVNSHEYALTTANVASSTFGKLFSCIADGAIYAQPLWVPNVAIAGGTHNVIVVVTMRDSVYVFDADTSPCVTYWQQTLIPSGETYGNYSDLGSEDIYPNIGILGTPVIDSSSNTIYLVTKTKTTGTTYFQRLHALDLATGAEKSNSPVAITGSAVFVAGDCEGGTTVAFNPKTQNQRPGLALVNGVVYVTWASHGDVNPFHGWVVGYRTSDLSISGIFNTSPTSTGVGYCRGGIWMSGGAPAADSNNNLYVMTGNGVFDGVADFGDSFLKLNTSSGLSLSDWFTPFNESSLDQADQDVGASGTALLIDQPTGPVTHLLVGGSKNSVIYVLNRDNMSHFNTTTDMVVQEFAVNGHSFSTPGFWNNRLYYFGVQFGGTQVGQSFTFDPSSGMFTTTASSQTPSGFGFPGATPSISATPEGANGIVWAIDAKNYGTSNSGSHTAAPAVLHAYDALNLANELWNSSQAAGGRDTPGNAVKFTVPTVANGKVYIGTRGDDDTQTNGTRFGELDV